MAKRPKTIRLPLGQGQGMASEAVEHPPFPCPGCKAAGVEFIAQPARVHLSYGGNGIQAKVAGARFACASCGTEFTIQEKQVINHGRPKP